MALPSMNVEVLEMGLAPGGEMRQEIYEDPYVFDVWDLRKSQRCFVGAVRRMRTHIRLLAQPESMRSIVGATQ